jgi:hypothetical protein
MFKSTIEIDDQFDELNCFHESNAPGKRRGTGQFNSSHFD